MSEQPATTGRVRASFAGWPASPMFPILAERFDRWLSKVKAETWDQGYNAGKNDLRDGHVFRTRNPHLEVDQ